MISKDTKDKLKQMTNYDLTLWSKVVILKECFNFIESLDPYNEENFPITVWAIARK